MTSAQLFTLLLVTYTAGLNRCWMTTRIQYLIPVQKNPQLLRQAMTLSDDLVIPTQGTDGDLVEVENVYDMAAEVDMTHPLRAVVLLTRIRNGTNEEAEAREFLAELEMPVMKSVVAVRREIGRMREAPNDLLDYENVLAELMGA